MSLNANYQKLEPGDEVRLLEIDGLAFGLDEVLYFHGYNVPHTAAEIPPLAATWISCRRKASGGRGGSIKPGHVKSKGSSHPPRAATRSQRCG